MYWKVNVETNKMRKIRYGKPCEYRSKGAGICKHPEINVDLPYCTAIEACPIGRNQ